MSQQEFNAQRLLQLYDRVADAPDAVEQLRRFVLNLAVYGKLVEQRKGDEPAGRLLERIEKERQRLVREGQLKKRTLKARERDVPIALELPKGWVLTDLGSVALKITDGAHKTPTYVEQGVPFVSVKDFSGGKLHLSNTRFIPKEEHDVLFQRCDPRRGDILLGRIGTLGKAVLVDTDIEFSLFVSVGLIRFDHNNLIPEFFRHLLNSPFVEDEFNRIKVGGGTHTNKLNLGDLHTVAVPIPPLDEQQRIVAKVNELLALLVRLETTRTRRETTRNRLTTASLTRLTAPETTKADFPTHARFALDNLDQLTTLPEQIKVLRGTILNLAVRGKLVEQDPGDEPSSELLKRIMAERAKLIDAGDIRKQVLVSAVEVPVSPFPVPEAWSWCRLGSLVLASESGWSPRTESHARQGNAWGVLKVSAVSWDNFDPDANKQVLPGTEPRRQAQVHKGDFLLSRANTAELVAKAVLVLKEPQKLMMSDKIVRLRLARNCSHRFVWLLNNFAVYARDYYAANATGVSPSMKNVSRDVILNLPLPLPPLQEQHRIVAKVDELIGLCGQLSTALITVDATRTRLLKAQLNTAMPSPTVQRLAADG